MDSDSELLAWAAKTNDWDHAGQRIETIASGKMDKTETVRQLDFRFPRYQW